ncbi:MAG: hypothetical protein GX213_00880 [Clostridiaceae bacterium]|nr:hypothetical protein [Clostridiaceae bacterium]
MGQPAMACRILTPLPWRPVFVEDRLLLIMDTYLDYVTGRTCFAVPQFGAVSSVACLEWGLRDNGSDALVPGQYLCIIAV